MPIAVHLKEMKELTDKFASIGALISEEDQVVTLLGSLSPSYSTLLIALEARVNNIQLDFVQQALIHEEHKQKGQAQNDMPVCQQDSALVGAYNGEIGLKSHLIVGTPKRLDTVNATASTKGIQDYSTMPRLHKINLLIQMAREHLQYLLICLRQGNGWWILGPQVT